MSRNYSDNGCLWIVAFFVLIQIFPFVVPPVYELIANDLLKGNCLFLIVVFAIVDIIIILVFKNNENKRKDFYEDTLRKEFHQKKSELYKEYKEKSFLLDKTSKQNEIEFFDRKKRLEKEYKVKFRELESEISEREKDISLKLSKIDKMFDGTILFQKIPSMYADARMIVLDDIANYLRTKSHPAYTAAETVQMTKRDLRDAVEQFKVMESLLSRKSGQIDL